MLDIWQSLQSMPLTFCLVRRKWGKRQCISAVTMMYLCVWFPVSRLITQRWTTDIINITMTKQSFLGPKPNGPFQGHQMIKRNNDMMHLLLYLLFLFFYFYSFYFSVLFSFLFILSFLSFYLFINLPAIWPTLEVICTYNRYISGLWKANFQAPNSWNEAERG